MDDDADLLAEQRAYYRARAPEYDEWWQRRGRYDGSDAERDEWDRQVAVLDRALADFGATGRVLELADLHRRRLADGSEWRVVKVMYEPDELNALLEAEGWRPQIDATRWFIHGSAAPG